MWTTTRGSRTVNHPESESPEYIKTFKTSQPLDSSIVSNINPTIRSRTAADGCVTTSPTCSHEIELICCWKGFPSFYCFFRAFETNTYILHKPLSLMLQVKLWNKQIPSYTQRHKSNTQTSSAHILPPSVSSTVSVRKHVWTTSALSSAFIAPPTWKLFRTVYQSVHRIHIHSADTDAPVHESYMQHACASAQCGSELSVEGHLVTPAMPCSLWSAVSVAVVVSCGDGRLAAQHFQPRQPTSEKEIWVVQMEGLLLSYLQNPVLVQHHPPYSIWELVRVVPAVLCVRELGGGIMDVDVNASAFTRNCRT